MSLSREMTTNYQIYEGHLHNNKQWPTVIYWVLGTQKCFDARKEVKKNKEKLSVSIIFLSVSKYFLVSESQ